MSGRRTTLASMGFNADAGSETAHTEAMGTRKKSVGSRCFLTADSVVPEKEKMCCRPIWNTKAVAATFPH